MMVLLDFNEENTDITIYDIVIMMANAIEI